MFHEHHSRSIYKSTTWFLTALALTFITLTYLGNDWRTSLAESLTLQILKAFIYYIHERFWNKSNYGQRLKKPSIVMK